MNSEECARLKALVRSSIDVFYENADAACLVKAVVWLTARERNDDIFECKFPTHNLCSKFTYDRDTYDPVSLLLLWNAVPAEAKKVARQKTLPWIRKLTRTVARKNMAVFDELL